MDDFSQLCLPGPEFLSGYNNRWSELRRGVNPLRDRLKLDNCVTPAMQVVMKLVELGGTRRPRARNHPRGELNGPWAKLRRDHTEETDKRPAVFYTYI